MSQALIGTELHMTCKGRHLAANAYITLSGHPEGSRTAKATPASSQSQPAIKFALKDTRLSGEKVCESPSRLPILPAYKVNSCFTIYLSLVVIATIWDSIWFNK